MGRFSHLPYCRTALSLVGHGAAIVVAAVVGRGLIEGHGRVQLVHDL